jgi:uncharacterized protein (TIGR00251 family)
MARSIDVKRHADGLLIPVRVKPRARQDAIEGVHAGQLKVAVTATPARGKANRAVLAVLAAALGRPLSSLRLVRGIRSREKQIVAMTDEPEEIERRLQGILHRHPGDR